MDRNQREQVEFARAFGATVLELDLGRRHGFVVDLLLGFCGLDQLVEVKNPATHYGRQGLNERQQKFSIVWRGRGIRVSSSIADMQKILEQMRHDKTKGQNGHHENARTGEGR